LRIPWALEALTLLQQEGRPVTKAAVAKRAGVSVVFLRTHSDLFQAIEEAEQRRLRTLLPSSTDRAKDQVIAALPRRLEEMKQTLATKEMQLRQKQREIDRLYGKLAAASPLTDLELRSALTEAHVRLKQAEGRYAHMEK
jgi:hypothetical protein